MAKGDKAAARGLAVYPSTQDRRLGYENDNERGDELADEIDARKAADELKLDKDKIRVQLADPGAVPEGTVWVSWV